MAKPLSLIFQGLTVNMSLEKVERRDLYGYAETEVLDDNGKRCELATLTSDGRTIVGKGGTALGYLSPAGLWRKKAELRPIDNQNRVVVPVKSTFEAPVTLEKTATVDEYLSHNIYSIYQLTPDAEHPALEGELKLGTIFQFPFSYRGGLEASAGFVLAGSDGNTFLCVGVPTVFEFIGLNQPAAVVSEADAAEEEEDDLLDFSLV